LFSVRKGLFFWSPALLFAAAGFCLLKNYKRDYVLSTFVFMALNVYIISSWGTWSYGGSFGHRAFVESIAVFAFGYASMLQWVSTSAYKRTMVVASSLLVLISARLMVKYWVGVIPYDRTTWQQFLSALRW
jgi:asparagine N-glycosylation enzyme membrane subunit Stt3